MGSGGLLTFVLAALEAREQAKFLFSRQVSAALEQLAQVGESLSLSREAVSFLTLRDICESIASRESEDVVVSGLRRTSDQRRAHHARLSQMALPPVVRNMMDLVLVPYCSPTPTFITGHTVRARTLFLDNIPGASTTSVRGCIVLLDAADPGFDCVFALQPAGLVTRLGGAGSHMAVRCAELGLPAAIGCGDLRFAQLRASTAAVLDCGRHIITPIDGVHQ